jgi:allophanate hydrolase
VPAVLGSLSTYVRGRFGDLQGRRLQQGDSVPLRLDSVTPRTEYTMIRPMDLGLEQPIRVILGPQADYFTDAAIETFLSSDYTISLHSDRMGYRLDGPALVHAKGYNIVSDGIVTGAIQVPGSGQPIVLMVDNPTTGGYPKVATVISADIPVLGRRGPGKRCILSRSISRKLSWRAGTSRPRSYSNAMRFALFKYCS